ncbi:MAG: hypothetical protein KIT83_13295 [Bryobacterales bacterium]|nr:hypothetical protein [Bryobacterales bacterium]
MKITRITLAFLVLAAPLFADFSYKTETKVTGGAMAGAMRMATRMSKTARSAMEGSTYIKGNRMADQMGDTVTVMDLDAETVTMIDHAKKQYSVVTFAEYQQFLEKMAENLKGKKKDDVDIRYSVKITDGEKKQVVGGHAASLTVFSLTVETSDKKGNSGAMDMVNDLWVSKDLAGAAEMKAFGDKLSAKLAGGAGQRMGAMAAMIQQQGGADAMKEFEANAAKLDGVPVLTVIRMGPAGSNASMMAQSGRMPEDKPEGKDDEKPSVGNVLRGMGGLGGLGRGRQQQEPRQEGPAASSGMLMEMAMRSYDFSTAPIADSQFQAPSGYKQVESEIKKGLR